MCIELRTKDVARAPGVRKQLFNRNLRRHVFIRIVGEVSAEGCFYIEFSILYKLKCGDGGEHLVHRSESEARLQRVRRFLLTICQSIRLRKNSLAILGDEDSAGKKISGHQVIDSLSQRRNQLTLAQVRNRKLSRSWEHFKLELLDSVWWSGFDFNAKSSDLIPQPFLNQQDYLRRCRLRDFQNVETTSSASHFCFAIKAFQTTRIILLQKGPALFDISRVENFQPRFGLVCSGCIGQLWRR